MSKNIRILPLYKKEFLIYFEKMPSKNAVKKYIEGGIYHVYNRGVNKQDIFFCDEDYQYFINLLDRYLLDNKEVGNNFYNKISLYTFCLMPSHIHLALEQTEKYDMAKFMRSLSVSYVMYVNKKYQRVGHLFQDKYKARLISEEESFIVTTAYIHKNPSEICPDILTYPYSSVTNYIQNKGRFKFVRTEKLLSYFKFSKTIYRHYLDLEGSDLGRTRVGPLWKNS